MNVLFIQTDQWPSRFFGFTGHPVIMTPTIDQLARDGVYFDHCYSTCPVCIPARRSLMTGQTPKTHGDRVYSPRLEMPKVTTLAQAFRDGGYRSVAVGKLHVYPQRSRIGFDEVILQEEGRYEFGEMDDYEIWLGEQGFLGSEFSHGMGNNVYYARPWPLPEHTHPTAWTTREMIRQIKRRDPLKPSFFYVSYSFPHPPLVPVESYLNLYRDMEMDVPLKGEWVDESFVMKEMTAAARHYTDQEIRLAKQAYYAQCTYIDHQLRLLIGTLRECGLLSDTLLVFTSDHGEMLFDHGMVGKRSFYENSAHIPLILSGKPIEEKRGTVDHRIACLEDVMPTLLDFCGLEIPKTAEGLSFLGDEKRKLLYGEISEGPRAVRMVFDGRHKLIYYPYGNLFQLFDLEEDEREQNNLAGVPAYGEVLKRLKDFLAENLYGEDKNWVIDGSLEGVEPPEYKEGPDYGFSNQRGLHWPAPGQIR